MLLNSDLNDSIAPEVVGTTELTNDFICHQCRAEVKQFNVNWT